MTQIQTLTSAGPSEASPAALHEFSLVNGGMLNQFWRRTRRSGDALQWVPRRALVAAVLTWVPLLLLSMTEGNAWGDGVPLTFLKDVETHLRLLIAVPLLILAELNVHRRLRQIVPGFVENGLIPDTARPRFDAAMASAMRLRNSVTAELLLIAFVYSVGFYVWRNQVSLDVSSWFLAAGNGSARLTHAGWWAALVSMPVFQFLMLRWYFRLFIWARFLWQVSRIDLNLEPTHPDGTAGLRFLTLTARGYKVFLVAMGTVLAGMIANRILYSGAKLLDFKLEIVGWVVLLVFLILGPMLIFLPRLRAVRRTGILEYSRLGQRYAVEFHRKWSGDGHPPDEPLLGSADIQSLADLRNAFMVVDGMQLVPFGMKNALNLAAYVLLPIAPLLLTTFSVEQLVERMLKAVLL
jgi:hypothetical protein